MTNLRRKNIIWIMADQLRAASLPVYGDTNITTPNIDKLASESVVFDQALSTCPVCTPYRSMLLTGRYPQTTGHIINFVRTRHDEISWADIFKKAGYRCGLIGKWHLHTGSFPTVRDPKDFVPEGRDRLGFDYFRGYNFHVKYFEGTVATTDWRVEQWEGYETKGLLKYVKEFVDLPEEKPFCMFLSVHQPHFTPFEFAPEEYYERLPSTFRLPPNIPAEMIDATNKMLRHYYAMTLAIDDMVGDVMEILRERDLLEDSIVVFTSDHGSQCGSQGLRPWAKFCPFEESIRVPFILRWPQIMPGGTRCGSMFGAQDILPTFAELLGIPVPDTIEGVSHAQQWLGTKPLEEEPAQLLMNFTGTNGNPDYPTDGTEWRGIRTHKHMYYRNINGTEGLYDLIADPYELNNLINDAGSKELLESMRAELQRQLAALNDEFLPGSAYGSWLDHQRRVIRNSRGPLPHPETPPSKEWVQKISQ